MLKIEVLCMECHKRFESIPNQTPTNPEDDSHLEYVCDECMSGDLCRTCNTHSVINDNHVECDYCMFMGKEYAIANPPSEELLDIDWDKHECPF